MEVFLWLLLIVPGFIYSLWRLTTKTKVYPKCGARDTCGGDCHRSRRHDFNRRLRYTSFVEALPPLKPGTMALFLLRRSDERYTIAGDFCGVFRIAEGRLMPLTKKQGFAPEYAGAPAVKAEEEILAQFHELRP